MSHEHLTLVRPRTLLRPADGSFWRQTFFFSIYQIYRIADFEHLLSLIAPQRILWNGVPLSGTNTDTVNTNSKPRTLIRKIINTKLQVIFETESNNKQVFNQKKKKKQQKYKDFKRCPISI